MQAESPPTWPRFTALAEARSTATPLSSSLERTRRAGLKDLLLGALQRIAGTGGDPVIELQTNFGGGKMLSVAQEWALIPFVPKVKWLRVPPNKFDFLTFEEADRLIAQQTANGER